MNMIILSGAKMKSFNVKEKEICINFTISDGNIKKSPDAIQELLNLKNENLNLALAPEVKEETFREDLDQLNFTIKCPDCQSYDVRVGEKIGLCVTCDKEFSIYRDDAREEKLGKKELEKLEEIKKEVERELITPFFAWVVSITKKPFNRSHT